MKAQRIPMTRTQLSIAANKVSLYAATARKTANGMEENAALRKSRPHIIEFLREMATYLDELRELCLNCAENCQEPLPEAMPTAPLEQADSDHAEERDLEARP